MTLILVVVAPLTKISYSRIWEGIWKVDDLQIAGFLQYSLSTGIKHCVSYFPCHRVLKARMSEESFSLVDPNVFPQIFLCGHMTRSSYSEFIHVLRWIIDE